MMNDIVTPPTSRMPVETYSSYRQQREKIIIVYCHREEDAIEKETQKRQ